MYRQKLEEEKESFIFSIEIRAEKVVENMLWREENQSGVSTIN